MSSTIYLVRHGQYGYSSPHLTPIGNEEIRTAASRIKEELSLSNGVDFTEIFIYHGPQIRARESAEIIARELSTVAIIETFEKKELDVDSYSISWLVDSLSAPMNILVSHKPDLEDFVKKRNIPAKFGKTGSYCKIVK